MFFSLQRSERDPLWRREMRERWRRPITLFFVTLYVTGLCWFAYSLYSTIVPMGEVELSGGLRGIGHRLFVSLLGVQIGAWIPFSLLLAAPTVAAERERRALTEYLLAGLLPRQIVRAKFASIATFITVMCAVPLPVLALCFPLGGVEPMELVAGVALEIAGAVTCAAVGLLISVNNQRVTSAMQSALIVSLISLACVASMLPGLLEISHWVWLTIAAFLVFVTVSTISSCEEALNFMSRHLEQYEREFQAPLANPTVLPAPPPVPLVNQLAAYPPAPDPNPDPAPDRVLIEGLIEGSSWDMWIEKMAVFNAVAQREVRVGLRASRVRMALSPDKPSYQFSPWAWIFFGLCGALIVWAVQVPTWWHLGLGLTATAALVAATSGSSAAFTREREQKMLAQLQMCPLSPLEIVSGKIGAMLLLVMRSWGGPLLGMFVVGLSQGVGVALGAAVLVALSLVFAVALATLFSLLCRHTAIATCGTLGVLLILFVLLPMAPASLVYFVPSLRLLFSSFPLAPMWIEPMDAVMRDMGNSAAPSYSLSVLEALFRLMCSLVTLSLLLIFAATSVWVRTSPDEGEAKERFWQRDISRSWR